MYIDQYDWKETKPTAAVVASVAKATNRSPDELPVLYEYLDPDALNRLLTDPHSSGSSLEITFNFDDNIVTLHQDGSLTVVADS
jgi:hypothetical protein